MSAQPTGAAHAYTTVMFEYVKNREIEQRRSLTLLGAVLLIAAILTVIAVFYSYA